MINDDILPEMPLSSILGLSRLGSLHPLGFIGDRIRGAKSRLRFGSSRRLDWKQTKLQEGGILVPPENDVEGAAGKHYQLVIGLNEV